MLFHHGLARSTVAFWVTSFMGLLLVYGLNTWLPQIMREAGYELGAALALLLVLNVGAVLGLLVAGQVADKIGIRRSAIGWFATAALFLALLSIKLPGIGVYISVLLTGMFVFSAQVLVYAYVAHVYPAAARGTALGAAAGIGRLGAITGPLHHRRPADRRPGLPVGLLPVRRGRGHRRGRHLPGQSGPRPGRADAGHRGRGRAHRPPADRSAAHTSRTDPARPNQLASITAQQHSPSTPSQRGVRCAQS